MRVIALSFLPILFRMPTPTCSNGCESDLPPFNFDDCQPQVNFSEIRRIFLGKRSRAPFANWKAATEWLAAIDPTATGDQAIRVLTVIGDKPAGAAIIKDISNGRKLTISKDQTLNFTIDDVSDENYEAMRQMECGGKYLMWYETEGGKLFGGNDGIEVTCDVNNVLGRGRDEIEVITGVFSWRAKFHPERADSPIFGTGSISAPVTYDAVIEFDVSATPSAVSGVTGATTGTDADQKMEFKAAPTTPGGIGQTMDIEIGGTQEATFSFLAGRVGDPCRYTDKAGVTHSTTWINGTRSF